VPAAAVELGDGLAAAAADEEALEAGEAEEPPALVSAPVTARPWVVLLGLGLELFLAELFEEVDPVALVLGLALDEADGEAEPVADGDGVELAAGVFGWLAITGRK
jgi:hypothetical protein